MGICSTATLRRSLYLSWKSSHSPATWLDNISYALGHHCKCLRLGKLGGALAYGFSLSMRHAVNLPGLWKRRPLPYPPPTEEKSIAGGANSDRPVIQIWTYVQYFAQLNISHHVPRRKPTTSQLLPQQRTYNFMFEFNMGRTFALRLSCYRLTNMHNIRTTYSPNRRRAFLVSADSYQLEGSVSLDIRSSTRRSRLSLLKPHFPVETLPLTNTVRNE